MKIVLISNGDIPPEKYGGTQRVVWWFSFSKYIKYHGMVGG